MSLSLFFFRNYEDIILEIFPVYSNRTRQRSMYVNGKFTNTFVSNFTAHIMKITGEDLEIHALDSFYNSLLKDVSNYSSKTDYNRTVEYVYNTIYDIYRQFDPEFESILRYHVKDNFLNIISINQSLLDRLSSQLTYRYKKFQRLPVEDFVIENLDLLQRNDCEITYEQIFDNNITFGISELIEFRQNESIRNSILYKESVLGFMLNSSENGLLKYYFSRNNYLIQNNVQWFNLSNLFSNKIALQLNRDSVIYVLKKYNLFNNGNR